MSYGADKPLGWRALKTPTAETSGFYGHVTMLMLQYLWPKPPGVWLGGPGCKPGHSGWSWWSPTIKIALGLIPVMSKGAKIWLSSKIWPWRSWSIIPKNNRDLNQGLLHRCSKFSDSSLNEWWVILRTSPWLIHTRTDTRTHRHRQRQYPKAKTGLG